ncbi:2-aminoethylphosphonate ABC transporter permease subunit [Streptomyces sp. NBC_01571]|uniref:2-aminoethylphosphonate ABC transporter permease subunit n=1 Tax=Streptomyces sp. NBC_01571 TaxID=2975883 RepID=UPI0022567A5A|nr:2-aminoethylphosphonate ABC transporter permease subunit [Streptomyces sp. NBC_01571]MCX4575205.1 2-aminoethylphosphonate ABC transporter permease subunit [Streptomyces sp. NBC_01571]
MASAVATAPAAAPAGSRRRIPPWAWALPPVAVLGLVFLYPLALVVQQSFQPDTGGTSAQAYGDVFASTAFREALGTTVWLAVGSTAGCLVLGFALALVIAFVPFPGGKAVARFIDVFLSFPSFLITLALLFLYGSVGIANGLWTDATGAAEGPFQFLTTPWGVLLAEITYFTPFVMRPLLAAFSGIETAQLEVASSLGARPARIVRQVILPEALPALAAGGSLVLVLCLNKAADAAGKPTTFALPYAAGLVTKAPHTENGRKLLDFMLSAKAQQQVSEIGGGFSARGDVKATDANAIALTKLMDGVEVFEPDWSDIDKNLTSYVEDWKSATGS